MFNFAAMGSGMPHFSQLLAALSHCPLTSQLLAGGKMGAHGAKQHQLHLLFLSKCELVLFILFVPSYFFFFSL